MFRFKIKFNGFLAVCVLVYLTLFSSSCAQTGINKTAGGALAGSAMGAGLGAIVGSQSGHAGPGIAIGAAAGALGGALLGNQLDNTDQQNQELGQRVEEDQRRIEENRRLIEELRLRGADARSSNRGVVINLPDILFHFDSDRLTAEANRNLEEISGVIRDIRDRNISVEGHTDSIGSVEYNKDLSMRRARSVASELRSQGVSGDRMQVRGFGEGSPIATNNTEEGRARNRRVEVIVEN